MPLIRRLKPTGYVAASLAVSIGGFLNGYDTGSVGAVVVMPQFVETMGYISPTSTGFAIAAVLFGGVLPSIVAGQLADRYGRLAIIAAGATSFAVGGTMQASAFSLAQFIAGRVTAGVGEGLYLGVVNVYITEIAPSTRRGTLASMPQLLVAVGICLGYFTAYGSVNIASSMAWRLPFVVAASIGALMAVSCLFVPSSPRWLVLTGRREKALKAIKQLDIKEAEAERDILSVRDEDIARFQRSVFQSIVLVFSSAYRGRTVLALFILGMVQLCGIDGVLYYAPTLFQQAGLPEQTAGFLASGISAVLICAISIPAAIFADSWGRRTSVITGGVGLSGSMLLVGAMYSADAVHRTGAGRWVVIVSIFFFALTYSSTWAMVGKIYASEIQPGHTRAASNALAQGLNFLTNGFVALITPVLLSRSAYGAYFLFGGLSLLTTFVLAVYMPETRGEPLESIQEIFAKPLRLHGLGGIRWRRKGTTAARENASALSRR